VSLTHQEMKTDDQRRIPLWVRWLTSATAFVLLLGHLTCPKMKFDWIGVALLGFVVLPWFIDLVRSVKLPGGTEVDLGKQQSTTDEPAPPVPHVTLKAAAVGNYSGNAKKILKTLWRYQREYFGSDPRKRWTFTVSPSAQDYAAFLHGLTELIDAALVSVNPQNNHCMLTNEGIRFCEQNETTLESFPDIYAF